MSIWSSIKLGNESQTQPKPAPIKKTKSNKSGSKPQAGKQRTKGNETKLEVVNENWANVEPVQKQDSGRKPKNKIGKVHSAEKQESIDL